MSGLSEGGCLGVLLGILTLVGALLAGIFGFDGDLIVPGKPSSYETPTVAVTATTIRATPEGTPTVLPGAAEATSVVGGDEDETRAETPEPTPTSELTLPPVAPETVTPAPEPPLPGGPMTPTPVLR